jgi:2-octaprenyl-6-methoxyphenol hydroxylase
MEITDSGLRDVVRQNYLSFGQDTRSGDPLAHMVAHDQLTAALEEAARDADIQVRSEPISGLVARETSIDAQLSSGESVTAGLIAGCDGAQSMVRELAKIPVTGWNYDRNAIVATVRAERNHEGVAVQHFLPAGTFALLPLPEQRCSIVWVERPVDAERLCAGSTADFEDALQARAGHQFGKLTLVDGPQHYPLRFQITRQLQRGRVVLLGDAAHTTHPLAGQGLNLGLRDVGYLMHYLAADARLGLDLGGHQTLLSYERSRRAETLATLGAADALFRLFSLQGVAARTVRDTGLGIVDSSEKLKAFLIRQASGITQDLPELLREETRAI